LPNRINLRIEIRELGISIKEFINLNSERLIIYLYVC